LAVEGGRDIAPVINELLSRPGFILKVATQDYHPTSHISFAANHPGPNNKPFVSFAEMRDPSRRHSGATLPQQLWPVHCVENSHGSEIIPEINKDKFDLIVRKGMDPRVEMYSAFADPFGHTNCKETGGASANLAEELKAKNISDVFVVGLAGDYCVKCTAIDSRKAGFRTWVIEEGVKSINERLGWKKAKDEMAGHGVVVVHIDAPELAKISKA
jgi:nicotinamidase-related amidase